MSVPSWTAAADAVSEEQDEHLELLLQFVCERKVVPVVGPGLLSVVEQGEELPLYTLVARRVAAALRVDASRLAAPDSLNAVVCAYLESARPGTNPRPKVYATVHTVLQALRLQPPPALLQLAEITDFDLYVSVTMDTLLEDAINQVRFGGRPRAGSLAYAPNQPEDLPVTRRRLDDPVVYHLLGRAAASPSYVATEEDTLEWLSALQSESRRPNNLFDDLAASHLLVIGCRLSNWPARFFLRAAKGQPLRLPRAQDQVEALVDADARQDPEQVLFMGHFSPTTWLMPWSPQRFVAELHRRWRARQRPGASAHGDAAAPPRGVPALGSGFVFISYSSQNLAQAERLRRQLDEAGLDTWFDKEQLQTGDDWEAKIRDNIRRCAVFVPLLSRQLESRPEAFFRKEWSAALERRRGMDERLQFILPAALDDLPRDAATVPEALRGLQWAVLPDGQAAPDFIRQVQALVRDQQRREKGGA